jgi:hypothetical protein
MMLDEEVDNKTVEFWKRFASFLQVFVGRDSDISNMARPQHFR